MYRINLVGNPNVGKTTLFNSLTSSSEHTGNYHGVTVSSTAKVVRLNGQTFQFVDLPGVYSLNTFSGEEEVAKSELLTSQSMNLVVVDPDNIRQNLYLCLQLLELGVDFKIVINNFQKVVNNHKKRKKNVKNNKKTNKNAKKLDLYKLKRGLEGSLGVECIIVSAKDVRLSPEFINFCKKTQKSSTNFSNFNEKYAKNHKNLAKTHEKLLYLNNFTTYREFDIDQIILSTNGVSCDLNEKQQILLREIMPNIIQSRYDYIDGILLEYNNNHPADVTMRDKVLLNPVLMIGGFFALFFVGIYLIFFVLGSYLGDQITSIVDTLLVMPIMNLIYALTDNIWLIEFFANGVFAPVLTVIGFVPQVCLLFVFISVLEDSGVIARMAYVLDDFLSVFGLSGKAVYIILLGLGCNSMATLAARTVSEENMKIKTALVNPYISCMARLPVYVLLATAFFGEAAYYVVVALYLLGLVAALIVAAVLNKTILKSKSSGLLLAFPRLQMVDPRHLFIVAKTNAIDMVKRIFTIVVSAGVVVWVLSHTSWSMLYTADIVDSILYMLANKIALLFRPIGLDNGGVVCALIVGMLAKELIVSTISIANNAMTQSALIASLTLSTSVVCFTTASAVSFLIFVLLYCPCVSNLAVLKREVGTFYMWFSVISHLTIAYMLSYVVYNLMTNGVVYVMMSIVVIIIIMTTLILIMKKVKHTRCLTCGKCK